jgi:hypothetical protein
MAFGDVYDLIPTDRRDAVASALVAAFGSDESLPAEPLAGGASGASVLRVEVADGSYVLRLDAAADGLREPGRHAACLQIASDAGVAPRLLYADGASGISVTDFIEVDAEPGMARTERILAAAAAVRRLHAAPAFPPLVDFMTGMSIIVGQLEAAAILPAQEMAAVSSAWRALGAAYPRTDEVVASHNDLPSTRATCCFRAGGRGSSTGSWRSPPTAMWTWRASPMRWARTSATRRRSSGATSVRRRPRRSTRGST